jgi:hypothetical protein
MKRRGLQKHLPLQPAIEFGRGVRNTAWFLGSRPQTEPAKMMPVSNPVVRPNPGCIGPRHRCRSAAATRAVAVVVPKATTTEGQSRKALPTSRGGTCNHQGERMNVARRRLTPATRHAIYILSP